MLKQTGCDAVMIGRAALGRPWIFRQVAEYLRTRRTSPEPSLEEKFDVLLWHLAEEMKLHGDRRGLLRMRRQMAWYVRGLPGAAGLRRELYSTNVYAEVSGILRKYRNSHPKVDSVAGHDKDEEKDKDQDPASQIRRST
jgi:tRNA-dihydrouridine synthase